jgi:hypothetical protein
MVCQNIIKNGDNSSEIPATAEIRATDVPRARLNDDFRVGNLESALCFSSQYLSQRLSGSTGCQEVVSDQE